MEKGERGERTAGRMTNDGRDLSDAIIATAIEVHRTLGPGFLETIYESAMCTELSRRGIRFERQKEATVIYRGREGEGVAADRGIVVSIDTTMSPALQVEGDVRDLIRAIQKLRKDTGLSVSDRITLQIDGADHLLAAHGGLIAQETNATLGKAKGEATTMDIGGMEVKVRLGKN